jgi:hypothetical protein
MHNRDFRTHLIPTELFLTHNLAFPRIAPGSPQASSIWRQSAWRTRFDVKSTLFRRCGIAVAALQLSACSWFGFFHSGPPAEHTTGSLSVAPASEFVYVPARTGQVSPNRIENTAMSSIVLKTDIGEAVRNDVSHALQVAGFKVATPGKVLSGTIETFTVNDVRSPALWTLKIHYVVHDAATQRIVYSATRTVKQKSPKFTNVTIALDDTVRQSVNALIGDPAFIKSVN